MNEPNHVITQQSERDSQAAEPLPINPNLGASLGENYEILQDDLRQVNEVAAGLNEELAGKSKQLRHLSFLIEQAKAHLGHMRDGIIAMRKERHKLANSVQGAPVMEKMLSRVTAERDQLRNELNRILDGHAIEDSQKAQRELRFDKRDYQIAEMTFELTTLRQAAAESRRTGPGPAPVPNEPPADPSAVATSAKDRTCVEPEMEIVPTERMAAARTSA